MLFVSSSHFMQVFFNDELLKRRVSWDDYNFWIFDCSASSNNIIEDVRAAYDILSIGCNIKKDAEQCLALHLLWNSAVEKVEFM